MSLRHFAIQSNRLVHGDRWAFDREFKRHVAAGFSDGTAFALAAASVFGRFVG